VRSTPCSRGRPDLLGDPSAVAGGEVCRIWVISPKRSTSGANLCDWLSRKRMSLHEDISFWGFGTVSEQRLVQLAQLSVSSARSSWRCPGCGVELRSA